MSNTVFVVKWGALEALPFLGPSAARYVRLPASQSEPCELVEPGLATVFVSRSTAERARDLAAHDLSTFEMTSTLCWLAGRWSSSCSSTCPSTSTRMRSPRC